MRFLDKNEYHIPEITIPSTIHFSEGDEGEYGHEIGELEVAGLRDEVKVATASEELHEINEEETETMEQEKDGAPKGNGRTKPKKDATNVEKMEITQPKQVKFEK